MPPLFMKSISLTLKVAGDAGAASEFNCQVHSGTIEAEPGDDVTYQTLCPDGTYSQRGKTTYALHLVGVQAWDAAALARFLDEHDGESLEFYYQAHDAVASDDTPAKSGVCIGQAPSYGGEVETWAEYDVVLPINGKPATVTAPPAALVASADGDEVLAVDETEPGAVAAGA